MEHTEGVRKYLKNTSWLVGEKIIGMMISFFVGVYLARYLGPDKLGLLSYAQSFVLIFSPFVTLGLGSIVVRELVKDPSKRDALIGTSFALKLIGVIVIWVILGVIVPFTNNEAYTNVLIIIVASGFLFQSFDVIDLYFQSKVLSKYTVIVHLIVGLIIPIIKVGLILAEAQLLWFAFVTLVQHFLVSLLFIGVYRLQKLSIFNWSFDKQLAKQIFKDCWPLMLATFMIIVYMKIDQIMLKNMKGSTEVGIYAVAVRISEVWYFIPMLITQSIFPAIVNAKKFDRFLYKKRMQFLYDFLTLISFTIAIVITLCSGWIINALFGKVYSASANVLAIHIWAGVVVFFGVARGKWIIAENLQKKALGFHVSGAFLNVIMNVILIPIYGAAGAALATLLSYSFCNVFVSLIIKEFREPFIMYMKSFANCLTFSTVRQLVMGKRFFE